MEYMCRHKHYSTQIVDKFLPYAHSYSTFLMFHIILWTIFKFVHRLIFVPFHLILLMTSTDISGESNKTLRFLSIIFVICSNKGN